MNCDSGHAGDPHAVRHDLVVFGATSFVGQILCRYLADRYGADPSMRWAVAGRSASKLETLRSRFGRAGAMVELIVVDAADEVGLWRMCEGAKVVVSTVGPYALYGEQLVKVCAESGTDYCDLSGEVQWIRRMIERYGAAARASGARIVHCCGFDSIPSDLGVWLLQREAQAAFGRSCSRVKLRVKAVRGGFSGGTVASLLNVVKEAEANPAVRIELADPYSLCFESSFVGVQQPSDTAITFDDDFASWTAPFVMSGINTRVVHRSNALLGYPYGREFVYDEAVLTGKGLRGRVAATAVALGLGVFRLSPVRRLLEHFVLPKPGKGPSLLQQERGFFDLRLIGRTDEGQSVRVQIAGDRDPGYGSTAKMLGEAAICLAFEVPRADRAGGFWTPASALGEKLLKRLQTNAGLTFDSWLDVPQIHCSIQINGQT
ncbi:MAG: saccharopine dehydrogenase family protein [Planctomycetia bacterium]|jgi:short subunit dehydrogenase-like uncharacterized protein